MGLLNGLSGNYRMLALASPTVTVINHDCDGKNHRIIKVEKEFQRFSVQPCAKSKASFDHLAQCLVEF